MIDSIVAAIVRPPRARYSSQDLGAYKFRHKGIEYHRNDFSVSHSSSSSAPDSVVPAAVSLSQR
jgi:hypothetical protein